MAKPRGTDANPSIPQPKRPGEGHESKPSVGGPDWSRWEHGHRGGPEVKPQAVPEYPAVKQPEKPGK